MGALCRGTEAITVFERTEQEYAVMGGPAWKYPDGQVLPVTKITHIDGVPQFEIPPRSSTLCP